MFMRIMIVVITIVVALILIGNLFLWMIAHGSGHKIPASTDMSFGLSSLLLAAFMLILILFSRKRRS